MNNHLLARGKDGEFEMSLYSESESVASAAKEGEVGGVDDIGTGKESAEGVTDTEKAAFVTEGVPTEESVTGSVTGNDNASNDGTNSCVSSSDGDSLGKSEEKNPWAKKFIGIPINYFSVGIIYGGSVSVLYPLLVVQHGVTSAFYSAAASLVTLFWSYKILFGLLCDCFPIMGRKWKPYIIIGWALCALMLVVLASMGSGVDPVNLVIMLTFANLGYVCADVAADGYMVWMAHHEQEQRRGKIQSLIYIMRSLGRIMINLVIIFAFSGPAVNCPGYESDVSVACTTDEAVTSRSALFEENPEDWCHQVCEAADFAFGLTIPQFAWIIAVINLASMPTYFMLHEEPKQPEKVKEVMSGFWVVIQKRAVWQVMLYTMVSKSMSQL